ncbi:MAG: guanylate kinase [Myxococcota bacterium]|nr:guanylate kinase [Myxococcota bacterium]MEC8380584.1 guanylate kinase [Myxococcota bacterium]
MDFAAHWHPPIQGALFVVTGPSGTGKTTLIRETMQKIPELQFSVSATTRAARPKETDGVDYHFLSIKAFNDGIQNGDFLEWAEVYGNRYGTLRKPIEEALSKGASVVLDIDYQGAAQVMAEFPEAISIYVLPPSTEIIEARLRNRRSDSESVIQKRMKQIHIQLQHCAHFEYLVVNDDLDAAVSQFSSIFIANLLKKSRRTNWVEQFTLPPRIKNNE